MLLHLDGVTSNSLYNLSEARFPHCLCQRLLDLLSKLVRTPKYLLKKLRTGRGSGLLQVTQRGARDEDPRFPTPSLALCPLHICSPIAAFLRHGT